MITLRWALAVQFLFSGVMFLMSGTWVLGATALALLVAIAWACGFFHRSLDRMDREYCTRETQLRL